jgi:hypothetical protein
VVALNGVGLSAPAISLPILPVGFTGPVPTPKPAPKPAGGTKLHLPSVTSFWIFPRPITITVKGKHRSTAGTTFHYSLDQSAGVLIEIQKRMPGRWRGDHCVPVTRRNKNAVPCARWVTIRVRAVRHAHVGKNTYRYLGLVGNGPTLLTAGAYRAYVVANNKAGWSHPRSAQFSAIRKLVNTRKHPARR